MGTAATPQPGPKPEKMHLKEQIDQTLDELETVTDEIRVKLHLAGMDANDKWTKYFEPKLLEARQHAREAKEASKHVIDDAVKAFKEFARSL
jgi:hypothetical protein